tara:strand:+ start:353 stop:1186 length:834 start_codon:yes stop_codon:yes gene_type:complete
MKKIFKIILLKANLYILINIYKLLRDYIKIFKKPFNVNSSINNSFKFIGNKNIKNSNYEKDIKKLFLKIIKKNDCFINVGANYGYYCCLALNEGIQTIAFEPIYTNLRLLYKNIKINNFDKNIEVFPMALGDRTEYKEIYGLSETASLVKGWMSETKSTDIVYTSKMEKILDASNFKNQQILFLIDVEGFEKKVLDGALSFIKMEKKPIWIIEIIYDLYADNPDYMNTFKHFFDNGYLCFDIQDNLQNINLQNLTTPKSSNFLFIDKNNYKNILGVN